MRLLAASSSGLLKNWEWSWIHSSLRTWTLSSWWTGCGGGRTLWSLIQTSWSIKCGRARRGSLQTSCCRELCRRYIAVSLLQKAELRWILRQWSGNPVSILLHQYCVFTLFLKDKISETDIFGNSLKWCLLRVFHAEFAAVTCSAFWVHGFSYHSSPHDEK